MDNLTIKGKLLQVLPAQDGTSTNGNWKKQDFIIETSDPYPKKVCVTCWNEKVDELAKYKPNDNLDISINIESREYNKRWYTDIKAWRIQNVSSQSNEPHSTEMINKDDSDLPF